MPFVYSDGEYLEVQIEAGQLSAGRINKKEPVMSGQVLVSDW